MLLLVLCSRRQGEGNPFTCQRNSLPLAGTLPPGLPLHSLGRGQVYVCMSCMRVTDKGLCVCPEPDIKKVELSFSDKPDSTFCYECERYVQPDDCACDGDA